MDIKTIGDAIMIRVPEAEEAVRLGLEIVHTFHLKPGFPVIHVGMHTGPAVQQGSDWLGASVNIAARVAGAAGGDEVLLTEATHDAVGDVDGVEPTQATPAKNPVIMRHVGPVTQSAEQGTFNAPWNQH